MTGDCHVRFCERFWGDIHLAYSAVKNLSYQLGQVSRLNKCAFNGIYTIRVVFTETGTAKVYTLTSKIVRL
jgi:hypothetical protein